MLSELARQLYQEIPFDARDAFIAYERDLLSISEIAASHGISRSTARLRVKEGRRQFEAALARWKAKHRDRALLFMLLTAEVLIDADRMATNEPDPPLDFGWRHDREAIDRAPFDAPDGDHAHAPGQADGANALMEASHGSTPASKPRTPPRPKTSPSTSRRLLIASLLAGLLVGHIIGASHESPAKAPNAASDRDKAIMVLASPPVLAKPIVPAPSPPASVAPQAPSTPPDSPESADTERADLDLLLETTIFDIARVAFTRGEMNTTIDALKYHLQTFPQSENAVDRDRIWIAALLRLSRTDEACWRAEIFRNHYPSSKFLEPLNQLCPDPR